jgi:hypothetical protein
MRVMDATTLRPIGHLSDISTIGIKVDSDKPLPVNVDYKLRVDLTPDMASKTYMIFNGRCRWCQMDKLEPNSYNVGFEVNILSHDDSVIFQSMFDKYGSESRW